MNANLENRVLPVTLGENRLRTRPGRLCIDIASKSFKTAFMNFSDEATAFAMSLTDQLHRRFACEYLAYLQNVANGSEPVRKNSASGRPACRLICIELERLFKSHFFKPERLAQCA